MVLRVFSDYVTSGVHCCHQKSFLASFHTFTSTSSSLHESPKRLIFCYCVLILFRPVSDHFVAMFSKTTMRRSLSSPNPRPSGLLKRSLMPLCLLSGHCFLRQRCLYVLYQDLLSLSCACWFCSFVMIRFSVMDYIVVTSLLTDGDSFPTDKIISVVFAFLLTIIPVVTLNPYNNNHVLSHR